MKTFLFTSLALIAFAANSVLCRLALGTSAIDAVSFTVVRLLSASVVLWLIISVNRSGANTMQPKGSWLAAVMLFVYALTFSFAYITLDTATGALILFGSVQISMILLSLFSGNRLRIAEWLGLAIAFMGFIYLVLPEVTTPSIVGFLLMTLAGIAWGIYTLKGRGSNNPLMDTTYNFLRTIPMVVVLVIVLAVIAVQNAHYSTSGILLAVLSGGIASGIGYAIWYTALGGLAVTQAAVVQLLVPIIAAVGGVLFVSEPLTLRLLFSATMILGGILLVVLVKKNV